MSLVVEDGSGVSGANSYVSAATFQAYALARKWTVPVGQTDCEALLISAMDYLELPLYVGTKKSLSQLIQWPRVTTDCYNSVIDVPFSPNLAIAQNVLANIAQKIDLLPATAANSKGPIISEAVYGAVSRTYGLPNGGSSLQPYLPQVRSLLRCLLRNEDQCVAIRS